MTKKEVAREPEQWADLYRDIRGQFQKGSPHKVILKHLRIGGKEGGDQDVTTWEKDHFEGTGLSPDEFAREVVVDILEDAKIFPAHSMQKYGLFFWHKEQAQYSHRIFVQTRGGGPEDLGDVMGSEAPNDEGRTSQLMRHDEAFGRLTLMGLKEALTAAHQMIKDLREQNAQLMAQFIPVATAIQTITTRTAEMDFKLEREKKMWGMLDDLGEIVKKFGPLVAANKIKDKHPELAQMLLRAATSPADEIVRLIISDAEALGQERMQQIFGTIGQMPHGQAIVGALIQFSNQMKAQAAAQQQQAAQTNGKTE